MTTADERPPVTLVVAMRNEAAYVWRCLESILGQDYPPDALEVLVYDGGSTDASRSIVAEIARRDRRVVLLDNPRRTQAAAWNQGIERARGEIVGIVSGHVELGPGYVAAAVQALDRTRATMVGGPVRAVSDGRIGRAVAVAISTPFGVGDARFRYTEVEEEVDTVYMGLSRTAVYRSFLFDERMVRNQDDELSYRILDAGGRIVCDPAIVSRYYGRATLHGLARQYFEYGFWKVRVIERHPRQIRPRHLVPSAFVASVVGSAGLAATVPALRWLPAAVLLLYGTASAAAAAVATRAGDLRQAPIVAVVFAILHVAYGAGMLAALPALGARWVRRGLTARRRLEPSAHGRPDDD